MTKKMHIKVWTARMLKKFYATDFGWNIKSEIEYFQDYGFWYGLKRRLFPAMKSDVFCKKMINYELRHYKGVDYEYIINLPLRPIRPYKKMNMSESEFQALCWDYNVKIIHLLTELYNGKHFEFQDDWLRNYQFNSLKEYLQFKKYFKKVFPKTKEWKVSDKEIEESFSWFNLQYGLHYGFDYREIYEYENKNKNKEKE